MGRRSKGTVRPQASPAGVRLRALLSLGMVVGLGAVGTLAAWSDEAKAEATFTAGKLDLALNDAVGDVALTTTTVGNVHPGSSWAGTIKVSNKGTIPLVYTVASSFEDLNGGVLGAGTPGTATQPALPGLQVKVYLGGTATNVNFQGTCSGTLVGSGPLGGALVSTTQPLQPNVDEILCIRLDLPMDAPNEAQGDSTKVTFHFNGKQH